MVFNKKKKGKSQDLPLFAIIGKKEVKGDVGLEIEVESTKADVFPKQGTIAEFWSYHQDGSLRGADNAEYILTKPIEFAAVGDAVDKLWTVFAERKAELADSNRTSVHVHVNISPFYLNRLASLMALWFTFEDVLAHWCGDHRVGNLFCLRAKDGPNVVRRCAEFIATGGSGNIFGEGMHYAALSPTSIFRLGSLEFRTLQGCKEPETIKTWVSIIQRMYEVSDHFKDPRVICEEFSLRGPFDFMDMIFGELGPVIRLDCGMTDQEIHESLYEGVRFAQEICYVRDWSDFNPVKYTPDPFGRSKIKRTTLNEASLQQMINAIPGHPNNTQTIGPTQVWIGEE